MGKGEAGHIYATALYLVRCTFRCEGSPIQWFKWLLMLCDVYVARVALLLRVRARMLAAHVACMHMHAGYAGTTCGSTARLGHAHKHACEGTSASGVQVQAAGPVACCACPGLPPHTVSHTVHQALGTAWRHTLRTRGTAPAAACRRAAPRACLTRPDIWPPGMNRTHGCYKVVN